MGRNQEVVRKIVRQHGMPCEQNVSYEPSSPGTSVARLTLLSVRCWPLAAVSPTCKADRAGLAFELNSEGVAACHEVHQNLSPEDMSQER